MLKIAMKHYLKSIGDKTFVPNPDFPEFVTADCLDVVIKRKPRWFWQHPIYTYDNFGLNDLLDVPLPSDKSQYLKKPEPLTPNYKWSSNHSVKGKLGAKIASLVSLEITGDDIITLSIDLQDMVKQSIDYSAVQNMLKTKKVNLSGKYLSRLAQDKYNVVCIVSQYIYLNKSTEIKIIVNDDISESSGVSKLKDNISDSGSLKCSKTKSIVFDVGSRIAFEFAECLISPDGSIELLDRSDRVKITPMIPDVQKIMVLPNYCAHITMDHQHFDTPDHAAKDDLSNAFKCLSYLHNEVKMSELKKHLLCLALENKNALTKLEMFFLHCQQESSDREIDLDSLKIFDKEMLKNVHLIKFFNDIGLSMKGPQVTVKASTLHPKLLEGILCLIQSIYHLEVQHLENLKRIVLKCKLPKIEQLLYFLQSVKFLNDYNKPLYERLVVDIDVKCLLRFVGLTDTESELNEYFEPVFMLLY